jgi:hypothetical protein
MYSNFVERSNGKYNNLTFPRDRAVVWRGTGLRAVRTGEDVFEFRVWDPKRPMDLNRVLALYSPDGTEKWVCRVRTCGFSCNVGESETAPSVNCGVMTVEVLSKVMARPKAEPGSTKKRWHTNNSFMS